MSRLIGKKVKTMERKLSLFGTWFWLIGKHQIAENQLMEFWKLMCGEAEIKKFLKTCKEDEYGWTIPEVKK